MQINICTPFTLFRFTNHLNERRPRVIGAPKILRKQSNLT